MNDYVWVLMCQDNYYIMDGVAIKFLTSIHTSKKGALKARAMRNRAAKKHGEGCKTKYTIELHMVSGEDDKPMEYKASKQLEKI